MITMKEEVVVAVRKKLEGGKGHQTVQPRTFCCGEAGNGAGSPGQIGHPGSPIAITIRSYPHLGRGGIGSPPKFTRPDAARFLTADVDREPIPESSVDLATNIRTPHCLPR